MSVIPLPITVSRKRSGVAATAVYVGFGPGATGSSICGSESVGLAAVVLLTVTGAKVCPSGHVGPALHRLRRAGARGDDVRHSDPYRYGDRSAPTRPPIATSETSYCPAGAAKVSFGASSGPVTPPKTALPPASGP